MKLLPPWFRIHLSTAIVLMLAASALVGLNFTENHGGKSAEYGYGWPNICLEYVRWRVYTWNYLNLAIDVLTAIVLMSAIAIVLEKRIAILQRLKSEKR